jgi:hypothetical protein
MQRLHRCGLALLLGMPLLSCAGGDRSHAANPEPYVMNVTARGLAFEAPDQVPSGWTTIRFTNAGEVVHFAVVEKLPEGIGVEEQQTVAAPIFQRGFEQLAAGHGDSASATFAQLPDWFGKIVFTGGVGLTGMGHTSEATVYLEPGTYLLECYVKTAGVFHSYRPNPPPYGMVHEFVVTDSVSGAPEPHGDLVITLSADSGIQVSGTPALGVQTVQVQFEDQKLYENFVGHDVHLVRLAEGTDLIQLAEWMDWTRPHGLETPAPAEFLGGLQEMPAGSIGYFQVDLTPGRYAWISEVANPEQKGMLVPFSVGMAEES